SATESANPRSAMATLLLALDALLHRSRRLRIFAADFGERSAGHFLLLHGRGRLREPKQRLRRLRMAGMLGRQIEERLRRSVILLALEQALAQPELRVGGAAIG